MRFGLNRSFTSWPVSIMKGHLAKPIRLCPEHSIVKTSAALTMMRAHFRRNWWRVCSEVCLDILSPLPFATRSFLTGFLTSTYLSWFPYFKILQINDIKFYTFMIIWNIILTFNLFPSINFNDCWLSTGWLSQIRHLYVQSLDKNFPFPLAVSKMNTVSVS